MPFYNMIKLIIKGKQTIKLTGNISPAEVKEALEKV